jgi:YebC/PmpR family DNA-binding regulatory protein
MSGHSKWSQIKRQKAKTDAARGRAFSRAAREIMVAVRQGGPKPDANLRLRMAVDAARAINMPMDNISRAIARAGGPGEGELEELVYEGYGPGGVAVVVKTMTSNRKRTASDMRYIFDRHGGNMGDSGCVSWMFEEKGLIVLAGAESARPEDDLILTVLDAGAEDLRREDEGYAVITTRDHLERVRLALQKAGIAVVSAEVTMIPKTTVELSGERADQTIHLLEALEENDDVQHVYANLEVKG